MDVGCGCCVGGRARVTTLNKCRIFHKMYANVEFRKSRKQRECGLCISPPPMYSVYYALCTLGGFEIIVQAHKGRHLEKVHEHSKRFIVILSVDFYFARSLLWSKCMKWCFFSARGPRVCLRWIWTISLFFSLSASENFHWTWTYGEWNPCRLFAHGKFELSRCWSRSCETCECQIHFNMAEI